MRSLPFAFWKAADSGPTYPSALKGMNVSGGSDLDAFWSFPSSTALSYYYGKGFNLFRIPFRWERIQHTVNGSLDPTHLAALDAAVQAALALGPEVRVMLVAHNFGGRYPTGGSGAVPAAAESEEKIGGGTITRAHFADLWSRIATYYAAEPRVIFDLMNEPESMPADTYANGTLQLVAAYNDAIVAIRAAESTPHLIALEGNGWNNAQYFTDDWYSPGTSSADAFASIVDSEDFWVASVHNYPDTPHGDEGNAVSATALKDRFANVLTWAQANNRKVMVGEFATHTFDPLGSQVVDDFLTNLDANPDDVIGWSWWEGRSRLDTASEYNIEWNPSGADDPKLSWLFGTGPVFDPTTDDPDGYWRASYSGSPWTPTSSAGDSGTNGNLVTLGAAPGVGTAVNGFTPATFNGGTQALALDTAVTADLVTGSALTVIVLAKIITALAAAADYYDDAALWTDSGGNAGLVVTASGVRAGVFVGSAAQTTHIAQGAGSWFLAAMRYDSANVRCRVASGGTTTDATPVAKVGPVSLGANSIFGANYAQTIRANVEILELAAYQRVLSDAELDDWKAYFNSRYALSL